MNTALVILSGCRHLLYIYSKAISMCFTLRERKLGRKEKKKEEKERKKEKKKKKLEFFDKKIYIPTP
jgi:hypothetical protein